MTLRTPLRLLIVGDSPGDTELRTEAVTQASSHANVVGAGSAMEGRQLARTVAFDLLVLDLPEERSQGSTGIA